MPFRRTSHIREADLSALLDGELLGSPRAACNAHLEACGECRAELDELGAVRSSLRALPRARARRSFALRESDVRAPRPSLLVGAMPLLSGVTVVALFAFLALVSVDVAGTPSPGSSGSRAPGAELQSADTGAEGGPAIASRDYNAPNSLRLSPEPSAQGPENYGAAAEDQSDGRKAVQATEPPTAAAPAAGAPTEASSDDDTGLRIAEGAAAALALATGGLALAAWRRTR